jgi:PKD repeat protein
MVSSPERNVLRFTASLVLLAALAPFAFATPSFNSSAAWNAVPTYQSIGLYWKPTGVTSGRATVRFRPQGTTTWREGHELWWDDRNDEFRGSMVELDENTVYEIQLKVGTGAWSNTTASCNTASATECNIPVTASCSSANRNQCTRTWSDSYRIKEVRNVTSRTTPLVISAADGGNETEGYVVYQGVDGNNTISLAEGSGACVRVDADFVVVRNLVLRGCGSHGVELVNVHSAGRAASDVIVEDNEITGWGGIRTAGMNPPLARNGDAAVFCQGTSPSTGEDARTHDENHRTHRIVVQRNNIHSPRYTAESWKRSRADDPDPTHPLGALAVNFSKCGWNHVVRWNDVYSTPNAQGQINHYKDAFGGGPNKGDSSDPTAGGFPWADSDIYGNRISHVYDDAISAEGLNRNVRIWGNYFDRIFVPIANAANATGPLYVWRNVSNWMANMYCTGCTDADEQRGYFIKGGSDVATFNGGIAYYYHNTLLQPPPAPGRTFSMGAGFGLNAVHTLYNFVSRNNIWHIHRIDDTALTPHFSSIIGSCSSNPCSPPTPDNGPAVDYDVFNGRVVGAGSNPEVNAVNLGWGALNGNTSKKPNYLAGGGNYPAATAIPSNANNWTGDFRLASGSLGASGDAALLPNFNDLDGPRHVGAQPPNKTEMKFGRAAATDSGGGGTTPPQAVLNTTPASGSGDAPLEVTFDASGSTQGTFPIASLRLQFGHNGQEITWSDKSVTQRHTYPVGTYTATLTVSDNQTPPNTSTVTKEIRALCSAGVRPTARLTASPTSGTAPLPVNFDAAASTAASPATITSYSITYGDGASGSGVTQSHTYQQAGNYVASLIVTDSNNCQSEPATQQVTVTPPEGGEQTVTLRQDLNNYTGTTDAQIAVFAATTNDGANDVMAIERPTMRSVLIRFAIFAAEGGPVPDNATITSATLSLYKYNGATATISAARLKRSWNEMQATWNVAATGTSWETAGALGASDVESTADGQGTVGDGTGCQGQDGGATCWLNINVTSGVQAFRTGTANHGWKLAYVSGGDPSDEKWFNSSENPGWPTLRPQLVITYSVPSGNTPAFRSAATGSYGPTIGFRAASSASTNGSSLTINRPAGTAANDVMIASVSVRPPSATIGAPAGWTLVRRIDNGTQISLAVFRKLAGSSEPASYTWDVTGATWAVGGIQSFTNVDAVNPIDVEAGQVTPTSLSHSTPSVTTTVANAMVVTSHTFATSTTWTPPSGMTEAFDAQFQPVEQNLGVSIEGNYAVQAAAGATGTKTATAAGSAGAEGAGATHILALRAAPAVLNIGRPAGTAANDVMIASISVRPPSATIGAPAGWTLVRRIDNGTQISLAVFRRLAGSSEPASHTWDVTGATWAVGGIQSFTNVDAVNPIDVEAGQVTPTSLSHATPSVTTTVANAMVVTAHTFATSTTWTPPSGMTEAFDAQFQPVEQNLGVSIEGNYVLQAGAGATGTKTATAAGSAGAEGAGATHILGLRPAP